MIPRFFRCGDPTRKCPNSVSREIFRERPGGGGPCADDSCLPHREEVGLIEGLSNGRSKLVYSAAAALALVVLLGLLLGGGDPAEKAIGELRDRLAPLESELQQLEAARPSEGSPEPEIDLDAHQRSVTALETAAAEAIGSRDPARVAQVRQELTESMTTLRTVVESTGGPRGGSGVFVAEARTLLTKIVQLDDDAELQLESVIARSPRSAERCKAFLSELSEVLGRSRRLAHPSSPTGGNEDPNPQLDALLVRLAAVEAELDQFAPPPPLPFPPDEADLVIAASGSLAKDLATPLAAAWSKGEVMGTEGGDHYLTNAEGTRILVKTTTARGGYEMLAEEACAVFFTDTPPTTAGLESISDGFRESRSVAEVVALDALTLLVNPDVGPTSVSIGSTLPFRIAAGPEGSAVRAIAARFGFPLEGASDAAGESAVLADRNLLGLGLFHEEANNLRAKRLAVQANEETLALKPSPFTIATEDYLFSFRIVAWTAPGAEAEALDLVKFTTSNAGQEVVSQEGFVDLRLTSSQGAVPPEILAALGSAIGSDTISSAQRLSTNFRFEVGLSQLDIKAQADLERLPRFVFDKFPSHKVVILGFTDSDGGPDINLPLSKDRAEAVASELRRSKVDASSTGLGPAFPVDTNASETGKAKNRRAEVWVVRP